MNVFRRFARLFPLAALGVALASCNKLDDVLNPKNGDDKLEDLLTGSAWRLDTLVYGHADGTATPIDSVKTDQGTFVFGARSKESGSNYGVGLLQHSHLHTDSLGTRTVVDTMYWYAGNWGSTSLEGKVVTLFLGRLADGSFNSDTDLHLDFLTREDAHIRLAGRRGYYDQNGSVYGPYRRYALSR